MVEGQGRPGFVKGRSVIALRADGATTIVDVAGTVQTGGPIARLGQRLIGGVSKMMLDRFFACLQEAKLVATDEPDSDPASRPLGHPNCADAPAPSRARARR